MSDSMPRAPEYNLTRSQRQSIAIYIRDGAVLVRAPLRMPARDIDAFVASKEEWIADKLAASRERVKRRAAFAPHYGDAVLFRGTEYPLVARAGTRAGFDGACFYLPPELAPARIKPLLVRLYRKLARIHLTDRVARFAAYMNVTPAAVGITAAKTRWGSCSARRRLSFSWRIVFADDAVIDYVVVHELAHITEMNHSARFWSIVAGVLPDWRERRARLAALQERLGSENWE
ncbi:MAG: M48 family metallopeptidase [Clostridiales Family XIII bacterium]|jgi:predicted metal-dependent hydrolase|nr:M48 family metallopeptidase [Clostridiales Family XIII bacterium]